MGSPNCPFCFDPLKLETVSYKSDALLRKSDLRSDFYICNKCKKYWPRHAAVMRSTARDGVKPKPKKGM